MQNIGALKGYEGLAWQSLQSNRELEMINDIYNFMWGRPVIYNSKMR